MALPKTETFTESNGTQVSSITGWTLNTSYDPDVQSNAANPDRNNSEQCNLWTGDGAFSDDQYSETTMGAVTGAVLCGPAVRCADGAETYYGYYVEEEVAYIFEVIAGSWNEIGTTGSNLYSASDVLKLEVEGTTLTPYINDSENSDVGGAVVDSSISSGYGGITAYHDGATTIDTAEMGNLGAPPSDALPMAMHHYRMMRN